ncbi:MAG: putative zinc-binding protein [Candidatus Helarchaeota archaeon]
MVKLTKKMVYIIPCSGIGKVWGSIGREAAYIIVNELRKNQTAIECLPLIVKGKKEVIDKIKSSKVIVIDGCPLKCANNNILDAIGKIDGQFMSIDIVKENRNIKPERDISKLGNNAKQLSRKLAEKIAQKVDELLNEETEDA